MKKLVSKSFLQEAEMWAHQERGCWNTENFVVQLVGKRHLGGEVSNLGTNRSRKRYMDANLQFWTPFLVMNDHDHTNVIGHGLKVSRSTKNCCLSSYSKVTVSHSPAPHATAAKIKKTLFFGKLEVSIQKDAVLW